MLNFERFTKVRFYIFLELSNSACLPGIAGGLPRLITDGAALGKPVIIGVELTKNPYNHVTFFEECTALMENELRKVSRYFAEDWAYKGIAIHDYSAWKEKECRVFLPVILKNSNP